MAEKRQKARWRSSELLETLTGKEMLPLALKAGWKVKAFLRTPSKVADQENLVKFKATSRMRTVWQNS